MKNFFTAIILFLTFLVASSTSTYAAICEYNTARQCGSLGGCTQGNQCLYNLEGEYFCSSDNTCPSTGIICGTNSNTIGACGPYAGCRVGERCNYSLSGGARCFPDNNCSSIPPAGSCTNNSVSDCTRPVNGTLVGVDVGTNCSTAGYTCQPQGGMTDPNRCICKIAPSPTTSPTITPFITPTPIPTLPPIESTGQSCESTGINTVYPPNSSCFPEVKRVELDIYQYPLTCIPAPEASYKNTVTGTPPSEITVSLTTDLSKVTLGFLGPDSKTISSSNPDNLSKTYLFNTLFDRPSISGTNIPREYFRTYWRVLSSRVQANLKAIYLEYANSSETSLTYHYLNRSSVKSETNTVTLYGELPNCLRKFPVCEDYVKKYQSLSDETKAKYDTLLPFDFENNRGYLALNGSISVESIPYLSAILSGLQGRNGLLNTYTPSNMVNYSLLPATIPSLIENTLHPAISARELFSSCAIPTKTTSATTPYTYPKAPSLSQLVTIPLNNELVSQTDDLCWCPDGNPDCSYSCGSYSGDQNSCENVGCTFSPGEKTYLVTGKADGKHITVLSNPLINNLNNIIAGKGNVGDPSFYRMIVPSFAPVIDKIMISAAGTKVDTAEANTSITKNGNAPVYRENALAQTAMHLIQSCWLVPSSMQSSTMCGVLSDISTDFLCEEDCSTTQPSINLALTFKDRFAGLASRWIGEGNPAVDKYETVVRTASAAGVDPIFALSSWLLESGASNYDGVCIRLGGGDLTSGYCTHLLDFGINKDEIASNYAEGSFFFDQQLARYVQIPNYYKDVCRAEMEQSSCPMRVFTAMFLEGNCTPSAQSDRYYAAIKNIYSLIAPSETFPCYPTTYP